MVMEFFWEIQPVLPAPMTAKLLVFMVTDCEPLVLRPLQKRGERNVKRVSWNTTKLTFLTKIHMFFLNKCSSDYCKFWFISRALKSSFWKMLLIAFVEEHILRDPYTITPEVLSPGIDFFFFLVRAGYDNSSIKPSILTIINWIP